MGAPHVIAAALLCSLGCSGPTIRQAAETQPAPSPGQDDGRQACDPDATMTDLRVELHDGDWGHGSIMVYAWIPKPVESLDAALDYARTDGKNVHLEDGVPAHEARISCGAVVLVGFDIDDFLQVDGGSVTLTDIVYDDGTGEAGPLIVTFEMNRSGPAP